MRAASRSASRRSPPARSAGTRSYCSSYSWTSASTSASAASSTAWASSVLPYPFTETPRRSCASTLSPSVTATWRMLSPNRATESRCSSCHPHAARVHAARRRTTEGSLQCPTTVFRRIPIRVCMNPSSRSPCADWFRFMKSMSISDQGSSRLNCVCRWRIGLRSADSPAIHIFAGENVCIQITSPTHESAAFASRQTRRIDSGDRTTPRSRTRTGTSSAPSSAPATSRACASTAAMTASPYISCVPATNQTSSSASGFTTRLSSRPARRGTGAPARAGVLRRRPRRDAWRRFRAGRR